MAPIFDAINALGGWLADLDAYVRKVRLFPSLPFPPFFLVADARPPQVLLDPGYVLAPAEGM